MVVTRLCAEFRHRTTRRLGGDRPRQYKETLRYLVDTEVSPCRHKSTAAREDATLPRGLPDQPVRSLGATNVYSHVLYAGFPM